MRRCIGLLFTALGFWAAYVWGQSPPNIVWMRGGLGNNPTYIATSWQDDKVAVVQGSALYIYRASDQRLLKIFQFPTSLHQAEFSRDGQLLFVSSGNGIAVWRVADWTLERTLPVSLNFPTLTAVSADSRYVAISDNSLRQIFVFERATGTRIYTLTGHTDTILALAFHPTAPFLISLGRDGRVYYWRLADGGVERVLTIAPLQGAWAAAIAPDGSLAAVARDNEPRLRLVALPAGSVIRELSALSAQRRLAFSPNGMLLASAGDTAERRVHLWRVADGEPLYAPFLPYEQGSGPVSTLAFTGDSTRLMVAGGYEDIPIWNVSEGVRIGSLQTFSRETPSLAFSADSGLLWTSSPNRGWLRAFDVATGALVAAPMRLAEGIQSFAFHPNRPILATTPSSPNAVRLWDLTTGEMFLSLPARVILGFAPEGELLWTLGSPNNTIAAWRLMPDGIRLQALFGGNGAATVDAQGMLIAQIQDGWLNLWDARTGQLLRQLPNAPYSTVQHIRISPNRRYVACTQTGFNELPVWNLETGEQYVLPLPLSNNPLTVAFSPDEEFIATTTHDQYLRLWRLRDRRLVGEYFDLIFRESAQLMFSPNGRYLALARRDGTIAVLRNPFFPDLNGDGSVDDTDLLEVLFAFGATGENLAADVNRDGSVDDADLLMVLFYFGQ